MSMAGEKHRSAKLTEVQVRDIKRAPHVARAALAERYGVGVDTISRIRHGITWRAVKA